MKSRFHSFQPRDFNYDIKLTKSESLDHVVFKRSKINISEVPHSGIICLTTSRNELGEEFFDFSNKISDTVQYYYIFWVLDPWFLKWKNAMYTEAFYDFLWTCHERSLKSFSTRTYWKMDVFKDRSGLAGCYTQCSFCYHQRSMVLWKFLFGLILIVCFFRIAKLYHLKSRASFPFSTTVLFSFNVTINGNSYQENGTD